MKLVVASGLALGLLLPAISHSAEPELCRPYAAALSEKLMQWVWKRAYNSCLNSETPPATPIDWQAAWRVVTPDRVIKRVVAKVANEPAEDLSQIGIVPAGDDPHAKKPQPDQTVASLPPSQPSGKGSGSSGYAKGSAQWNAYCRKYWPASWDQKTGTVIKSGHKRIPCPA